MPRLKQIKKSSRLLKLTAIFPNNAWKELSAVAIKAVRNKALSVESKPISNNAAQRLVDQLARELKQVQEAKAAQGPALPF